MLPSTSALRSFVLFAGCVLLLVFSYAFASAAPDKTEEVSGLSSVNATLAGEDLIVYGISNAGVLEVRRYDPSLKQVALYTKNVPGFKADSLEFRKLNDSIMQFRLRDTPQHKTVFVRLNTSLVEKWSTPAMINGKNPSRDSVTTLSSLMEEKFSVALILKQVPDGKGGVKQVTNIAVSYHKMDAAPKREGWRHTIDSSVVEYGNVFLVRNGRLYVYVNHNTSAGKQFIYCYNLGDGKLIYKTRLVVGFTDQQRKDDAWHVSEFSQADACIFSNYYWDEKINGLVVGGTWLIDSARHTGLFLAQLNDTGAIRASIADYAYWLSSNTFGGNHSGKGYFSRNSQTYYRIASMGYQADGTLSVLSEVHAKVNLFRPKQGSVKEEIYRNDEDYHFMTMQAQYFQMTAGSIKPKCATCVVRAFPWSANHHLDSIQDFVPKTTKMGDDKHPDDINRICDASNGWGNYVAAFRDQGTSGMKVLTRETVDVNGTQTYPAYFQKKMFSLTGSNWVAFLDPDPVAEQNFSKRVDYFAGSSKLLWRVEYTSNGYKLGTVTW